MRHMSWHSIFPSSCHWWTQCRHKHYFKGTFSHLFDCYQCPRKNGNSVGRNSTATSALSVPHVCLVKYESVYHEVCLWHCTFTKICLCISSLKKIVPNWLFHLLAKHRRQRNFSSSCPSPHSILLIWLKECLLGTGCA